MAVTVAMRTQVSQLYVSLFGRAPDSEGLGFWVAALSGGVTVAQVAESMYNTAPARAYYPAFATNQEIVSTFYLNVLGRPADAEGLAFWVKELAAAPSKGAFFTKLLNNVVNYTGTDADGLKSQALFVNKVTVAQYYGENNGSIEESTAALNGVTHDVATVAAAKAIIDGEVGGETYALTSATDKIDISTAIGIDTIRGIVYQPLSSNGESTFTLADEVRGNDKTVLQLLVAEAGEQHIEAPYVTVAGIDKLEVIAAQAGSSNAGLHIDASTYGTDISMITLGGKDDFHLEVLNLDVTGQLDIEIAAGTDSGNLDAEGVIDGLNFDISATNSSNDDVGVDVVAGVAGIDITLGEEDFLLMSINNTSSNGGAAVAGDITIGDVNLEIGKSANLYDSTEGAGLKIYNSADSTLKGAATAGSITIGDVKMNLDYSADVSFTVSNDASAVNGAAKVGDITVGDIDVAQAISASVTITINNSADSVKGDATVGDITIGNTTVVLAKDAEDFIMIVTNSADADTTGNATAGNITMGDITVTAGDDVSSHEITIYNYAFADKGNATVGSTTLGDISFKLGNDGGEYIYYDAYVSAAVETGNALVGDVAVGDIGMDIGNSNRGYYYLGVIAGADVKGNGTVGNVAVGDINLVAGQDANATFELYVSAYASAGSVATVGNVSVGDAEIYGEPDAYVDYDVQIYSNGKVGNVTLGNADMTIDSAQDGAEIYYYVEVAADDDVGNVKIGDLSMNLGSSASLSYFSVNVSVANGDLASFSVGNIDINGGINSYDGSVEWTVYAENDIGDVKIGDITVDVGNSATFESLEINFEADTGSIGNIQIGDQTFTAGEYAVNDLDMNFSGDDGIGNIIAGDVTLTGSKLADIWVSNTFTAYFDIGNITYGDISVDANGVGADVAFSLNAYAYGDSIGAVSLGDIDVTVSGSDADAYAWIWLDGSDSSDHDQVGDLTIGNITLNLSNSNTEEDGFDDEYVFFDGSDDFANAEFEVDSNGNIKVGNVTVTAGDVTAEATAGQKVSAEFILNSEGSITVGNITVVGGQMNADEVPEVMDNFYALFDSNGVIELDIDSADGFMDLTIEDPIEETFVASGTIGNVDYRGYEAKALIDVSAYKGAANIYAAQDDTAIIDNKSKNVITLGAGNDDVVMNATNATTDKLSASAIDEIINFTSLKDHLTIISNNSSYDEFDFVSSNAGTYANFLADAAAAMDSASTDIYARVLDGSVYVAVDKDDSGTVDFVVKLTGITTLDVSDISIID